ESLRLAIENAVNRVLRQIDLPGISDAELNGILLDSVSLDRLYSDLKMRQNIQTSVSATIRLFLRVSNTDLLETKERITFDLNLSRIGADAIEAIATTSADWEQCWVRGIGPIRREALEGIRDSVSSLDETLSENDTLFMAAMVLLASEMVGPYVDRLATFLE